MNSVRISIIIAATIALSACATSQTEQAASPDAVSTEKAPMMDKMAADKDMKAKHAKHKDMKAKHKDMKAKHDAHMKNMPPECKAMMEKMREKMKSGDMDMDAMKKKMKSGEGMSEKQKECHTMMHEKMHGDADSGDDIKNKKSGEHKH